MKLLRILMAGCALTAGADIAQHLVAGTLIDSIMVPDSVRSGSISALITDSADLANLIPAADSGRLAVGLRLVAEGVAPFALMRSPFGKFIVAGKFVRVLYAVAKASAFAGLALQKPFPALLPELWSQTAWFFTGSTYFFVYLSVALCIARGLPVIAEFVHAQKSDILRRPGRRQ